MIRIDSTNIYSVGYHPATKDLFIRFCKSDERGDLLYTFHAVPRELYQRLLSAKSSGKVFLDEIKGKFPHDNVEDK